MRDVPVANNVTRCPRATSPSVSNDVNSSTELEPDGGIEVATGPTIAMRSG